MQLEYLKRMPQVRDVLLSEGDPHVLAVKPCSAKHGFLNPKTCEINLAGLVERVGVEPTRCYHRGILSSRCFRLSCAYRRLEWTKPAFWGDCECIVCIVCIVSMGIARQLHVRITKGMVVHRPGIHLFSITFYLSGVVNRYLRLFDSLIRSMILGRNLWG